jgi:uncharacterized membrane protein SirB2
MKNIKKIVLSIIGIHFLPLIASAQLGGINYSNISITTLGIGIANATWVVFTIIAIIAYVISGILFLTAYGEPEKLRQAKSAAIWGLMGILVALLAFGAVTLVRNIIGV